MIADDRERIEWSPANNACGQAVFPTMASKLSGHWTIGALPATLEHNLSCEWNP